MSYQEIIGAKFSNVAKDALTYFHKPKAAWINWEDCGIEFTCTGLYNGVYKFIQTQYVTGGIGLPNTFDVVSNNLESTSVQAFNSRCSLYEPWNAWLCDNSFGIMMFDSLDEDRMDRNVAPVHIRNPDLCNSDGECFDNRLNSFMDNCWDGFYGCQEREQRYPSMIWNDADYYEVYFTGTPPENLHFRVFGDSTGFIVKIVYSNSNSYAVKVKDGNASPQTQWNDKLGTYTPLSASSRCGDNRYLGT